MIHVKFRCEDLRSGKFLCCVYGSRPVGAFGTLCVPSAAGSFSGDGSFFGMNNRCTFFRSPELGASDHREIEVHGAVLEIGLSTLRRPGALFEGSTHCRTLEPKCPESNFDSGMWLYLWLVSHLPWVNPPQSSLSKPTLFPKR
jgi:hypothetical protein